MNIQRQSTVKIEIDERTELLVGKVFAETTGEIVYYVQPTVGKRQFVIPLTDEQFGAIRELIDLDLSDKT